MYCVYLSLESYSWLISDVLLYTYDDGNKWWVTIWKTEVWEHGRGERKLWRLDGILELKWDPGELAGSGLSQYNTCSVSIKTGILIHTIHQKKRKRKKKLPGAPMYDVTSALGERVGGSLGFLASRTSECVSTCLNKEETNRGRCWCCPVHTDLFIHASMHTYLLTYMLAHPHTWSHMLACKHTCSHTC